MIKKCYRFLQLIVFYTELSMFGLGALLYNILCFLVSWLPNNQRLIDVHQFIGVKLMRFFLWMIDVTNLCKLHRPSKEQLEAIGPSIIIANHTGLMDVIVLNALFPKASCVYKSKLGKNPAFSHILRRGGHLRNDEGIDLIRKGAAIAKAGRQVVVFPEGTRNQDSTNFTFKKGFALMAMRAGVPVTLFGIDNPPHAFSREMGIRAPELPYYLTFQYIDQLRNEPGESVDAYVERIENVYNQAFSQNGTLTPEITHH